jgi:cytochrome oxidase Cu insertion factor (SCO1/SenC/PrrC family)
MTKTELLSQMPRIGRCRFLLLHLLILFSYLRGQYVLLYFGFTHCPDICPSELLKVAKIQQELGMSPSYLPPLHNDGLSPLRAAKRKAPFQVKPVFISVDPARDTIDQLKYYSQGLLPLPPPPPLLFSLSSSPDFHPSFSFLTGTKQQIDQAARAFRVYFSKVDKSEELEEEYLVDHSIVLYLIDPQGEFLDFYTQGMTAVDITDKILKEMNTGAK